MIKENLEKIQETIAAAAKKAGKTKEEIMLLAVTKTIDPAQMQQLYDLGVRQMGENRVQEWLGKYPVLPNDVQWHIIGHLQRNKVRYIIEKVSMIESLDSIATAEEIEKRSKQHGICTNALVQVNIGKEPQKSGVLPENLEGFLEEMAKFSNVNVRGLMAIAPNVPPQEARRYFAEMKTLFDRWANQKAVNLQMEYLSMGMSHDFAEAIEEGANIVRIGTALFGKRISR